MSRKRAHVLSETEALKIDVQTQYNETAEAYAAAQLRVIKEKGDPARDFISQAIGGLAGKVVLDLGCGYGFDLVRYQQESPKRVFGVDPSEKMVNLAREKVANPVDVMLGCAERIPLADGSVDVITSRFSLHYIPDLDQSWEEIGRVLRPQGILAYITTHPMAYFRMKGDKGYDKSDLVRLELFDERVPVYTISHSLQDFLSPVFFQHFTLEDFMEGPDVANNITEEFGVPGIMGVRARRR